ncbi:hypothetical protein L195_g057073 [Trifolium pratense]|uniref:Uncharacterized protein n=1 Tax=Trifolium pratense TaxID=57577 RepID=A0A2K3KUX8_TRIPR|nr:hypothetical protein L195_g057073 [Trifolium pratense]
MTEKIAQRMDHSKERDHRRSRIGDREQDLQRSRIGDEEGSVRVRWVKL